MSTDKIYREEVILNYLINQNFVTKLKFDLVDYPYRRWYNPTLDQTLHRLEQLRNAISPRYLPYFEGDHDPPEYLPYIEVFTITLPNVNPSTFQIMFVHLLDVIIKNVGICNVGLTSLGVRFLNEKWKVYNDTKQIL